MTRQFLARAATLVTIALLVSPVLTLAQTPARPIRGVFGGTPPDPNGMRQELRMTFSLTGGYDDNLTPQSGAGGGLVPGAGALVLTARPSGYLGYANTNVNYFVGKATRSVGVSGGGYVNAYSNAGIGPGYGGTLTVNAQTRLGSRTGLAGSQSSQRSPYYSMGLFGDLPDIGGTNPDTRLTNSRLEGTSWIHRTSASVSQELTRRWRASVSYGYGRQSQTTTVDSRSHSGSARFDATVGRASSLRLGYARAVNDLSQLGRDFGLTTDTIDGGFSHSRSLSRTRTLSLYAGGGLQYVDQRAVREPYWSPTSYAGGRIDIGRSWSASGDYRQSLNVLATPILSSNYQLSHTIVVGSGGSVGRVQLAFDGGYSNGSASGGGSSRYNSYTASAQALVPITRWWSSSVSVHHYRSTLSNQGAQGSFQLDGNAVQVGFVWDVPLFGYFGGPTPRGGRRN